MTSQVHLVGWIWIIFVVGCLEDIFDRSALHYLVMADEPEFKYKQCLIVRADLKMSCGKKCAQLAHAAVMAAEHADKGIKKSWFLEGQKKVVLKAPSERALYELKVHAEQQGISTSLVQDAGLTEIAPGTVTALGLGPAKSAELDRLTGGLPLL